MSPWEYLEQYKKSNEHQTLGGAADAALNGPKTPFFDNPASGPSTDYSRTYRPPPDRDLTRPGAAEEFWSQNSQFFSSPTYSEGAYNTYSPIFEDLSSGPGPTYSQQAYGDFRSGVPADAGLDGYYDNAAARASEQIDRAAAARGEFNSGAALEAQSRAMADLGAEKANREADYRLRRAGLGGQLAQGATGEALSGDAARLTAARAGSELAGDADATALGRRTAGIGAAAVAQNAREGRIRGAYDDTMQMTQAEISTLLPQMHQNLTQYAELQGMPFELQMALAQAQINNDQAQVNNILSLAGVGVQAFGAGGPFA